jgi:hypothetical protein
MSFPPLIGPQAPERNPPIEPQYFQPSWFPITAISYGVNTTITTGTSFGVSNNYVVGQLVRLLIPFPFGAQQLNEQEGYVIGIPGADQVLLNINTSVNYDPFISSPLRSTTPASIVAVGDINSGSINASGRTNNGLSPLGTFTNISPSAGG